MYKTTEKKQYEKTQDEGAAGEGSGNAYAVQQLS